MTPSLNVNVNGKDYALDSLPQAAQVQVTNVQVADAELARLQQQLALVQTARNAYVAALVAVVDSIPVQSSFAAAVKPAAVKKPVARKTTKKS